jgi:hypothetical protein
MNCPMCNKNALVVHIVVHFGNRKVLKVECTGNPPCEIPKEIQEILINMYHAKIYFDKDLERLENVFYFDRKKMETAFAYEMKMMNDQIEHIKKA